MKRIFTDFLSLSAYIRMIRVDPCSIHDWLSSYRGTKNGANTVKPGGRNAVAKTRRAIQDVGRWWP